MTKISPLLCCAPVRQNIRRKPNGLDNKLYTSFPIFISFFLGCSWWWEKRRMLRRRKKKSHWICYSHRDINPMIWSKWRKKQNSPSVSQLNPGHVEFRVKAFMKFPATKLFELLASIIRRPHMGSSEREQFRINVPLTHQWSPSRLPYAIFCMPQSRNSNGVNILLSTNFYK